MRAPDGAHSTACRNGILEEGEQCDDGNGFDGDGCSHDCTFEDPSGLYNGTVWLCNALPFIRTHCCPTLYSPVTGSPVCDCQGEVSPEPGFTISPSCESQDVDECLVADGGCHTNAVCQNLDGTLLAGTHRCICPPGMIGDGVRRCDFFVYRTKFSVAIPAAQVALLTEEDALDALFASGALPAGVERDDVEVVITLGPAAGRRLLEEGGGSLSYTISSDDEAGMDELVASVNVGEEQLGNFCASLNQSNCTVGQVPEADVESVDQAFGPISTVLTGFHVGSVVWDSVNSRLVVSAQYVGHAKDTIASLYLSKAGQPPYSQASKDSFFISQHPCIRSNSVCCLNDVRVMYEIGPFSSDVEGAIGSCPAEVRAQDTMGMWNTSIVDANIDAFFDAYPTSFVRRVSATEIELHISTVDLSSTFAVQDTVMGGSHFEFVVGMAYYTMLPAPVLSTTASHTKIIVTLTSSISFSFATQQDYTFIRHINMALSQVGSPGYACRLLSQRSSPCRKASRTLARSCMSSPTPPGRCASLAISDRSRATCGGNVWYARHSALRTTAR